MISLRDITVAYEGHAAVHHVSGTFPNGSLTAVVGPNGAGKSSLVKAILGEAKVVSGEIDLGGLTPLDIGYLPQVAEIDRSFPLSVADTVLLGAWRQAGAFGRVSREMRERGRAALATVGLDGFERRQIGALSAGQFRRVLFARLLVQDARVLILDEPFAALDARTTHDLLHLVDGWHQEKRTVIAVLHDYDQIRTHFPDALLLARELVAWGHTADVLSAENLRRARAMSEDWDEDNSFCDSAHRRVA